MCTVQVVLLDRGARGEVHDVVDGGLDLGVARAAGPAAICVAEEGPVGRRAGWEEID